MSKPFVVIGGGLWQRGSTGWKWAKRNLARTPARLLASSGPVALPPLSQHPSPNYSTRTKPISLVVLHDTEGPYASAVNWLSNPAAQASAHVVLREDGAQATQLVRWSKKAWACVAFNSQSLNLEMAGYASKGYSNAELDAAAVICAYWCKLYGIPIAYSVGGLKPGITFHQDLGTAGGGHHDPGFTNAQKIDFVNRVKAAAAHVPVTGWGKV